MKPKLFLSYAFTGEDKETVTNRMDKVRSLLRELGFNAYCNFDDPNVAGHTMPGQYIESAIKELKTRDVLIALIVSERRIQGQLMEIGAALALDKPVYSLIHTSAVQKGYVQDPTISTAWYEWSDERSLQEAITHCAARIR